MEFSHSGYQHFAVTAHGARDARTLRGREACITVARRSEPLS